MDSEIKGDDSLTDESEIVLSEESVQLLELLAKWGRGLPQPKIQEKLHLSVIQLRPLLVELEKYRLIAHNDAQMPDFRVAPSEQQLALVWKLTPEGQSLLEVGVVDA